MKTLKNTFIAMLAIFAVSCNTDDVENRPVVTGTDAPVIEAPEEGNNYVLNPETLDVLAERFVWTPANFGEGIIPNYDVEIDFAGEDFDTPVIIGTTNGTTQLAASVNVLNSAVQGLDATPFEPSAFQVRVKAYVGEEVLYSNAVEMIITPYQGIVPLQNLYLVGTATEYDFNNNNGNAPMFRDPVETTKFYFTGYFNAGELKLLASLGAWQPQYGSGGEGILAVSTDAGDPAAIVVGTAGYYEFMVDLAAMTYSLEPFDAEGTVEFASVGIIGAATPGGWDNDTDLTNSAFNPHLWKIASIALTADVVKFRANDSWDEPGNWGGGTPISGQLSVNGSDFQGVTEPGNYNVWFNDLDRRYIFIKIN